jgi:hypothetical protein
MREVCNLIGSEGTAATRMLGPAKYSRLEERAVNDELTPAFEEIEQANFATRTFELVLLWHRQPWHSPSRGGERITVTRQGLFLHEKLLTRSLPFFNRYDRGRLHYAKLCDVILFVLLHVSLLVLSLFTLLRIQL